jgi:diaminohydroxyphosphoribosylaminopyrimidine deaminase / 5-amino-6-(5-phosphoribosylamino)uracil reductase
MNKEVFMEQALALAEKGRGKTLPNPMVGCVIVKNEKIAGVGWHESFGKEHAEAMALKQAGKLARGATMFVSLEPCSTQGKQPPCTKAIIQAGIKKVFVAMHDPNPKHCKKGVLELKKNGIIVDVGLLEEKARALNEVFEKTIKSREPFVVMKTAMTLDGKIAWGSGKKKKVSGKKAREKALEMRNEFDAIMVGINTVKKDNPRLTARTGKKNNPVRIIVDSKASVSLKARALGQNGKTIVACTKSAPAGKLKKLEKKGIGVMVVKEKNRLVSLKNLMKELGKAGIYTVLIEGGAALSSSALKDGIVDKLLVFINPRIMGKGLNGWGKLELKKEILLEYVQMKKIGEDCFLEARIRH